MTRVAVAYLLCLASECAVLARRSPERMSPQVFSSGRGLIQSVIGKLDL